MLLNLFQAVLLKAFDTPPVRAALRLFAIMVLLCVLLAAVAHGEETKPAGAENPVSTSDPVPASVDHASAPAAAERVGEPQELPHMPVVPASAEPADAAPSPVVAETPGPAPTAETPATPARAREESSPATTPSAEHAEPSAKETPSGEIAGLLVKARGEWNSGDHKSAERDFTAALEMVAPLEAKRDLLHEMAHLYEMAGDLARAVAVREKYFKLFFGDRDAPQQLLDLGMLYRQMGAYTAAINRFFQVLNSTLQLSPEDLGEYRKIAMKARLEIAETYVQQGEIEEARKYFERLQLLDLDPADRERVHFQTAQMYFTLKLWVPAEKELRDYIAQYAKSLNSAEARYMRARVLEALERKQDAVEQVLELLRMPNPDDVDQARRVGYWKRRTGNELANEFYEQGDFLGSLAIYQALARASTDPSWRWPAVYQIGLCFERLGLPDRAVEAYDTIVTPDPALPAATPLPESLTSLQDMARWRKQHLDWVEQSGKALQSLSAGNPAGK